MIIYHNPRCAKSRQTLALLRDNGFEPTIVEYLKSPLTVQEIEELMKMLGDDTSRIVRVKDPLYKELGFKDRTMSLAETAAVLSIHPKLLERPIVVRGTKAVLGRPPENVLRLISG